MLINDDWKIEADDLNITLYHRTTILSGSEIGKDLWTEKGFYATLQNAYNGMIDKRIYGNGLKDIETVMAKIKELRQEVARWIEQLPKK